MAEILIVDDSLAVINDILNFLISERYDVSFATDGREGFKKAMGDKDLKLILVDYIMPLVDGLTMIKNLREAGNNTNIVMLSEFEGDTLQQLGVELGVKGWITKPFNGEDNLSMLSGLLNLDSG